MKINEHRIYIIHYYFIITYFINNKNYKDTKDGNIHCDN